MAYPTGTPQPGHDLASGAWNMDTGASSHLNNSVTNLHDVFNTCMYPSISVGDGHSIPVTNTGHSILPTPTKSLHLNNVLITPHIVKNLIYVRQFVRDNNCTIEFDAFGFFVKDFLTCRVLLRCDSTGDLYPVTAPSPIPHAFLVSQHMWHQRLRHPGGEVLLRFVSSNFISYNKEKPLVLCHACQLGKHVMLPFVSSNTMISYCFDIIHSDVWTSPIPSLLASSESLLQQIIRSLHQEFAMTDLGPLNYFLGISVTRDSSGLFLSQKKYAIEILDSAHMDNCNPSRTPIDTESKLGSDVQQVCLHMYDPREPHLSALKRILRYVRGTLDFRLQLFSSSTTYLVAYSDADWAGCPTTRRCYCVFLGNNLVSWNLLRELHTPLSSATLVYCDNVNAVYLSSNPVQHQRTKHIEIDIHFVRDLVAVGQVRVLHVPSRYQFADIFTKSLHFALFEEFRSNGSEKRITPVTDPFAGEGAERSPVSLGNMKVADSDFRRLSSVKKRHSITSGFGVLGERWGLRGEDEVEWESERWLVVGVLKGSRLTSWIGAIMMNY
ncbi:ribonuclease H-like domain-containing protein [Tanacetum coccineum]